jgi:hypothetical protein
MKIDDILEITRFHVRDSVVLTSPLLFSVLVFTFNNLTILHVCVKVHNVDLNIYNCRVVML